MSIGRVGELIAVSYQQLRFALLNLDLEELPSVTFDASSGLVGRDHLPAKPAVYFIRNFEKHLMYVGSSRCLRTRFGVNRNAHECLPKLKGQCELRWWFWPDQYLQIVEAAAIQVLRPTLNIRGVYRSHETLSEAASEPINVWGADDFDEPSNSLQSSR